MQRSRRGEGRGGEGEDHNTRRLLRKKATACNGEDEVRDEEGREEEWKEESEIEEEGKKQSERKLSGRGYNRESI